MKWVILGSVILMSCTGKTPERKWADYISNPKNKITQAIKIGEVQATIQLQPEEYRKFRKVGTEGKNGGKEEYYYFSMKFEKGIGDKPEKEKLLYLNFDMQNDFIMLLKNDSIPPSICQRIPNGKGGSYEYLLAFENRGRTGEDFTVFYHDKIFGIGTIAFVYKQDDIRKIPALKTN